MNAEVPWQNFVYFAMTIPSLPLYVVILGTIIHRRRTSIRFTTTFYALIISLGVADLFSQATGCFTNIIRTCNIFNKFYWENRHWIAPMRLLAIQRKRFFSYNCVMFCMNLRLFGATLIAIQRYVVVCLNAHQWADKLTQISFRAVFLIHWLPPFLYTLPILTNFEKDLMGPDDMRLVISNDQSSKGTFMQNAWVLVTFSISAYCYLSLLCVVMNHQVLGHAVGPSKELRLSVVALGQAIAFTVMFSYYTLSYILAVTQSPYQQGARPYMTILTGIISYWNPWIYYFLNGDIRKEVKKVLGKKTTGIPTVSSSLHSPQQGSVPIRISHSK